MNDKAYFKDKECENTLEAAEKSTPISARAL